MDDVPGRIAAQAARDLRRADAWLTAISSGRSRPARYREPAAADRPGLAVMRRERLSSAQRRSALLTFVVIAVLSGGLGQLAVLVIAGKS